MNKYLWIVPFVCFLSGYGIMSIIYQTKTIQTPVLVGKTIQDALRITAQNGLSVRLISEQEDPELPAGTIILQNPQPNTHIKSHQAIRCVISKKTEQRAPQLVGKNVDDCTHELGVLGIKFKIYAVASTCPEGLCIAQDPVQGSLMTAKTMILYKAESSLQQFIFPDLRQKNVDVVKNFLSTSPAVAVQISHVFDVAENHTCSDCIVSEQRPRPGTIVTLDKEKPMQVQLIATPVVNSNE